MVSASVLTIESEPPCVYFLLCFAPLIQGFWGESTGNGTHNGPVLLEGGCALDAGLVGSGADVDVVDAPVAGDGALLLRVGGRVVGAEVLDDVVLDERVLGPPVDGKVLGGKRLAMLFFFFRPGGVCIFY